MWVMRSPTTNGVGRWRCPGCRWSTKLWPNMTAGTGAPRRGSTGGRARSAGRAGPAAPAGSDGAPGARRGGPWTVRLGVRVTVAGLTSSTSIAARYREGAAAAGQAAKVKSWVMQFARRRHGHRLPGQKPVPVDGERWPFEAGVGRVGRLEVGHRARRQRTCRRWLGGDRGERHEGAVADAVHVVGGGRRRRGGGRAWPPPRRPGGGRAGRRPARSWWPCAAGAAVVAVAARRAGVGLAEVACGPGATGAARGREAVQRGDHLRRRCPPCRGPRSRRPRTPYCAASCDTS